MNRPDLLARLRASPEGWDMIVIGGGATGVGIAIDAASRGYSVALLEQSDFGKGTSSRSTKLVHGGVRYLQQGDVPLVLEALKERGILRSNAPHLVGELPFVVPNYKWWEAPFYGVGMRVYDVLAGRYGFGPSRNLSVEETVERIPTIETEGLRGGVVYHDGQFDDARLLIDMVATAVEQGAVPLNYVEVTGLLRNEDGFVDGVVAVDRDPSSGAGLEDGENGSGVGVGGGIGGGGSGSGGSGQEGSEGSGEGSSGGAGGRGSAEEAVELRIRGKVVINATGIFSDQLRRMDDPTADPIIRPSQGVHLVLDREFLPGDAAIMVPRTDDDRVLFAIPWHERVIVGTTDTPVTTVCLEPRAMDEEVEFLLGHAARYLTRDPARADVRSVFTGIRPLVAAGDPDDTAKISRDHQIRVSESGMVTIAGGKWTTYRKMAEEVVDAAATLADLESRPCVTEHLKIHGHDLHAERFGAYGFYGSSASELVETMKENPELEERVHPRLGLRAAQVVWGVRREMARTVDDALARRSRSLLVDARAASEAAPRVAEIMARELGRDDDWTESQVRAFQEIAEGYVLQ